MFLLHGFPEFWYAWRHQIPALAGRYTVVAPDLRGYRYTEKAHEGYDKRTMASDVRELATLLGFGSVALIGHDRGARVALRLARDAPEAVSRLAVLGNVPAKVVFETMDAPLARGQWWFLFNQVANLPEVLIAGREEIWLRHFFTSWCHDPQALTAGDVAGYVRAYSQPGAVMGACNDYRAGQQDQAQDAEDAGQRLTCPVLALWGADFGWVGQAFDVAAIWAEIAGDLRTVELPSSAHLPHEEQPAGPLALHLRRAARPNSCITAATVFSLTRQPRRRREAAGPSMVRSDVRACSTAMTPRMWKNMRPMAVCRCPG